MKAILMGLCGFAIMLSCTLGFAQPPIISHNVDVMQNATPSQCHNFRGRTAPEEDEMTYTRFGEGTDMSGPGVRTCRGCSIDPNTKDCVCKTCYDYFGGF